MEKYVSIMKQKLKVPQEDHSLIGSSRSSALTSLHIDTGAPNEYFSENEPLTTENENLDAFKAFSSAFLCCWKEFICSSLPAG